jgi:two-component system, LytTR family, response regulator
MNSALRIAIVDDEPAARRALREQCLRHPTLSVVAEFGDPRAALASLRDTPIDLVFLDIRMDTMSGLDLARALQGPNAPMLVFVTAYDQYALEAFEVCASDYLLKPFDDARFQAVLNRVQQRRALAAPRALSAGEPAAPAPAGAPGATLAPGDAMLAATLQQLERVIGARTGVPPRLLAESNGRWHMLELAQIEAVEADRNYVLLRVGADAYRARSTMQQAESALQAELMLRISRSVLVNTRHIVEVSRTPRGDHIFVLRGGVTLTSSEGFREPVRERLSAFQL